MEIQRRRQAVQPPPIADAGEPRLLELLRAEIEHSGPLTFARFMQRALYEPGLGYYASSTERPARRGDFLTAPELHPVFGHTLARQLHEMWQRLGEPDHFRLREYGAGSGALVVALLEGLHRLASPVLDRLAYQPLDLPAQTALITRRLTERGYGAILQPASGPLVGCVLANEFVDALPVQRVEVREGRLRELYVDWHDDGLVEHWGEPSSEALADWFREAGVELAEGQRAEVNLAMFDWLAEVGADLEQGYLLVIDYGAEPADLYGPRRRNGTLRAFRDQHVSDDVLRGVGRQDLTAHVDLAALRRGAQRAGLGLVGQTAQASFLLGSGLEEAVSEERARAGDSWEEALALRSAVARLLDPRALGGYTALLLGRDVAAEPALRGLSAGLPARA
jgi:SAM-dependent MidA family methyltransferase